MSTPAAGPVPHITILQNWRTHSVPRDLEAVAQWFRDHPAPAEKPTEAENARQLLWFGTPATGASGFGSVKFSPRRGYDLASTDGFFFDVDGNAATPAAMDVSCDWLDANDIGYIYSPSHSGVGGHIQLLADSPCPAHDHARLWKYIHAAAFPLVDSRQSSPARGRNAPRAGCDIQVFPGRLVPVQEWLALCPALPEQTSAAEVTPSEIQLSEHDEEIVQTLAAVWERNAVGDMAWGALGGILYRAGVTWARAEALVSALAEAVTASHPDPVARAEQAYDELHQMGFPKLLEALQKNGAGISNQNDFAAVGIEMWCSKAYNLIHKSVGKVIEPPAPQEPSPAEVSAEMQAAEVPEPLIPELLPFPLEALPPAYRDMVIGLQEEHRAPLELGGALVLAAMQAAVQRRFIANPHGHWREELASYTAVALPPACSKSPVFRAVMAPIMQLQATLQANAKPLVIADETERKILAKRIEMLEKEATREGMLSGMSDPLDTDINGPLQQLVMAKLRLEQRQPVRPPLLVCQQSTAEALIKGLQDYGRLACLTAEGSDIFASMMGQYSDKDELSSVWLSAFDGEDTSRTTLSRGAETASRPVLTICVTTQPSVLSKIIGSEQFRGRGMLARFTWVVPNESGPRWAPGERTKPVPETVLVAYHAAMQALWGLGTDEGDPVVLVFSPEAEQVILRIRDEVELSIQPGGDLSEVRDWASKHRARVARVAAALHLAWGNPPGLPVSGATVELAALVGQWMASHATKAFGDRPVNQVAADVLTYIKRSGEKGTSQREIQRKFKKQLKSAEDTAALVQQVLVPRGCVRVAVGHKGAVQVFFVAQTDE